MGDELATTQATWAVAAVALGELLAQAQAEHTEIVQRARGFLARTETTAVVLSGTNLPDTALAQAETPVQTRRRPQALQAPQDDGGDSGRVQVTVVGPAQRKAEWEAGVAWIESRKPAMRRRADERQAQAELEQEMCTGICEPSRCYITGQ